MEFSNEPLKPRTLGIIAVSVLAASALISSAEHDSPEVEAKLNTDVLAPVDNHRALIERGTAVTALCSVTDLDGFALRVKVNQGSQEGKEVDMLRRNLDATTDPYDAHKENPKQDPFGPLPRCDELPR